MKLLGKRRQKARTEVPAPGTTERDPLDAVPRVTPGVDVREEEGGLIQLRYVRPPKGRVERFMRDTLRFQTPVRINLDATGSFFWRQIDGQTDLHVIAKALRKRLGVSRDKAREATVIFTRDLMLRGMIQLQIDAPEIAGKEA